MAIVRCPAFTVSWKLYLLGGGVFDLPVKSWSITRNRKDPLSWEATLPLNPSLRRTGSIGQYLNPKSYDASWALQKWLICVITLGTGEDQVVWTSPKLVVKNRRYRIAKKEKILTIGGLDRFEPLLEKDVVEDDVRSVEDALVMIHSVINESLAAVGITSTSITFTDFPVKAFHRTGTRLQYLRELWDVYQCNTQWVEDTLVISPGGTNPADEIADFTLTDGEDATVIDYQESDEDTVNEVTVERPRELKRATVEPIVGKVRSGEDHQVSVSLETPLNFAYARIRLFAPGKDQDWVWDDEEGTPLVGAPTIRYIGDTKAATLRFNIFPADGTPEPWEIAYAVEIVGEEAHDSLGGFESDNTSTAVNSDAQGEMGPRRPDAPVTMQHIPNQTICQAAAEALVVEELLNYETAQVEAPLRKFVDPGQTGALTSVDLDLEAHNMRAQTVQYKQDSPKALMMTVGLGRGPT